jgi:hypothetical protein
VDELLFVGVVVGALFFVRVVVDGLLFAGAVADVLPFFRVSAKRPAFGKVRWGASFAFGFLAPRLSSPSAALRFSGVTWTAGSFATGISGSFATGAAESSASVGAELFVMIARGRKIEMKSWCEGTCRYLTMLKNRIGNGQTVDSELRNKIWHPYG